MDVTPSTVADDVPVGASGDLLHRAAFARRVASLICDLPPSSGVVFGIYGKWGDGKTSLLNMVRESLTSRDTVVVRDFNPWHMTDETAILKGFFALLKNALKKSQVADWKRKLALRRGVEALRFLSKSAGYFWGPAGSLDAALGSFERMSASGDSVGLEEMRDKLIRRLSESTVRIVVFIDDIDRLDRSEVHALFRLVKACADFPNVSYVLAFDADVVAKSLAERYGDGNEDSGRAFLQKIVQVPLNLPAATPEDLRSLCLSRVDRVLESSNVVLTQEQVAEFVSRFDSALLPGVATPRAAKQYGNALSFSIPALKNEANVAELLLLEGLRCFHPDVYSVLRDNHAYFTGAVARRQPFAEDESAQHAKQLMQGVLDGLRADEAKAIQELLISLFPRIGKAYGMPSYGGEWVATWSAQQRIASPDYAPRFFTYGLPTGDIADSEIGQLVDTARTGSVEDVRMLLREAIGRGSARRLIQKLRGLAPTIDAPPAAALALALAGIGGLFPSPPSLFGWETPYAQAAMLVSDLVQRVPDRDHRIQLASLVMADAQPAWFGAECLRWLNVTDDEDKQDRNALADEELQIPRGALIERIRAMSRQGEALFDVDDRNVQSLLFEWWRAEGRDPVQEHLFGLFQNDCSQLGAFLEAVTPQAWGSSPMPRVSDFNANVYQNVELLIDPEVLAELVRKCWGDMPAEWVEGGPMAVQDRLAQQFLYIHQAKQSEGDQEADGESA